MKAIKLTLDGDSSNQIRELVREMCGAIIKTEIRDIMKDVVREVVEEKLEHKVNEILVNGISKEFAEKLYKSFSSNISRKPFETDYFANEIVRVATSTYYRSSNVKERLEKILKDLSTDRNLQRDFSQAMMYQFCDKAQFDEVMKNLDMKSVATAFVKMFETELQLKSSKELEDVVNSILRRKLGMG